MPRWGNSTLISSLLTFMVQTPFLQPSRPTLAGLTRLCGCVFGTSESCVTQLTTTTAGPLYPQIWILGNVFLSAVDRSPCSAPAPRPSLLVAEPQLVAGRLLHDPHTRLLLR